MISKENSDSVLMVAAEDSSALYGLRLLQLWREQEKNVQAFGIGSRSMEKAGFEAIGRSEALAVVGVQEVLAHWSEIKGTFYRLLAEAEKRRPKFALLLDYPDFNLRLAKKLKRLGIPVVYYISPQIWAWRQGRVKLFKKYVDKVLTLFPFENRFYEDHGVKVDFVGHPLLDELARQEFSEENRRTLREKYGVKPGQTVLGLMPGSRRSELNHHLQIQLETARLLRRENSHVRVFLMVAPGMEVEELKARMGPLDFPVTVIKDEPFKMIDLTDLILCASGTATMMVGLLAKPMVIMYRVNGLTAFLAKKLVKHSKYFGMVNLILDKEAVPERFQKQANPRELARLLQKYISESEWRRRTVTELEVVKAKLGERGATARVARSLEEYFR